jgi:cytochrome P450
VQCCKHAARSRRCRFFGLAVVIFFRVGLPGFRPIILSGPAACKFVLVEAREQLSWRPVGDPVADLLQQGLLMTDGGWHQYLRQQQEPSLHSKALPRYLTSMVQRTQQVMKFWQGGQVYDFLPEMRKVALLILVDTLFGADFSPQLHTLWQSILKTLAYISPGVWLLWRNVPRPGYRQALLQLDQYLYHLIETRRIAGVAGATDLLAMLLQTGWSDALIRDQMLTMLIAGHDTSTALLAWACYLLGKYPQEQQAVLAEIDATPLPSALSGAALQAYPRLGQVISETLRLYPPIHVGNRMPLTDLAFQGYRIPKGQRLIYSIYLTHRHPDYWEAPDEFRPARFEKRPAAYSYLPFGGGPRICIGFQFAEVEAKLVLATLLQAYRLELVQPNVHLHLGATLEPRPGVHIRLVPRSRNN